MDGAPGDGRATRWFTGDGEKQIPFGNDKPNRDGGVALEPGSEDAGGAAAELELVGAVGEVAEVELIGTEVFYRAEVFKFAGDFGWGEEELERLAGELDAGGERVVSELLEEWEDAAGLAVVEDEAAAFGLGGDEADGGAEGFQGEVRNDAEPSEEAGLGGVEAGGEEAVGERFAFEVDGGVG